ETVQLETALVRHFRRCISEDGAGVPPTATALLTWRARGRRDPPAVVFACRMSANIDLAGILAQRREHGPASEPGQHRRLVIGDPLQKGLGFAQR
ncbi:MAG: hypothetical protein ACE5I3_14330, partial [Phycisphaerae bacterium]